MAAVATGKWLWKCGSRFIYHNPLNPRVSCSRSLTTTPAVSAAWNRDWKPADYPQTQAEREAAAAKYGVRIEDYEPYDPRQDPGYGDYPKIKWVGAASRDPYEEYDYPHLGTNFKEVLHVRCDQSVADRYDPGWESNPYYSRNRMIGTFVAIFGGGFILDGLCEYYGIHTHMPVMPKQFPDHLWIQRGKDPSQLPEVVHYTFEPESSS